MEEIPTQCPKCSGKIKHIPAGISKKTGKRYGEFWPCESCDYVYRKPKEFQKAVDQTTSQVISVEVLERLDKIGKKLEQVIYLITGVSAENNKEEFEEIMKSVFGKGLLGRG